jgi:uncharacterized protein (DUF2235 family)
MSAGLVAAQLVACHHAAMECYRRWRLVPDEELRRMSDRKLAAWCQKAGVMFAQVKAHLAERFPETRLKVVSNEGKKS